MNKKFLIFGIIVLFCITGLFVFRYISRKLDLNAIDNNGNGNWDDYEVVLIEKYRKFPNVTTAALQTGRAMQDLLDPVDIMEKDRIYSKAMSCLVAAGLQDGLRFEEAGDLVSQVRDIVISSDARQIQYIKYNSAVSGKMLPFDIPDLKNCQFQIEESAQ